CIPVCFMLLGGHFLSRRQHIGHYMAWWGAFLVIAQGAVQLSVSLPAAMTLTISTVAGGLAAVALMLTGVVICQRLLSNTAAATPRPPAPPTAYQLNLWTVLFIALVTVYAVNLYRQTGPVPVTIIVGSMVGGMIGWRLTTAHHPADPAWSVPIF